MPALSGERRSAGRASGLSVQSPLVPGRERGGRFFPFVGSSLDEAGLISGSAQGEKARRNEPASHARLNERRPESPSRLPSSAPESSGTMFLSQARDTDGLHIVGVADLNTAGARSQLKLACWPEEQSRGRHDRRRPQERRDDDHGQCRQPDHPSGVEVVIEATGDPGLGIRFALQAIGHGKHIVMVQRVEADAVAGPILVRKAKAAGVVYSLAPGRPARLIADHVDWARAAGFKVVCAGTRHSLSSSTYHQSTPDYGLGTSSTST